MPFGPISEPRDSARGVNDVRGIEARVHAAAT